MRWKRDRQGEDQAILVMSKAKKSNVEIGKMLRLTEGAIRHRKRTMGRTDGRTKRASGYEKHRNVVEHWVDEYAGRKRRPTLKVLHRRLVEHHGCELGYDAFRRYASRNWPEFMSKRSRVRVETPPGELLQIDWKEDTKFQLGGYGQWRTVHLFVLTCGFSRGTFLLASRSKTLDSLLRCQQEGLRRLGGLPRFVRPDCMKSVVLRWRGEESELNRRYAWHMKKLGIDVFPSRPGHAEDKGKVEKRIRDVMDRLDIDSRVFHDMADLQDALDRTCTELSHEWRCGATGLDVAGSLAYERKYLQPLPVKFPRLPEKEQRCRVRDDGTVYFEKNYYQVPKEYCGKKVLCVFTGLHVEIHHEGRLVERYRYLPGTSGMVVLSESALMDPDVRLSDRVRCWGLEVARRQVDYYQDIVAGGFQ